MPDKRAELIGETVELWALEINLAGQRMQRLYPISEEIARFSFLCTAFAEIELLSPEDKERVQEIGSLLVEAAKEQMDKGQ